MENKDRKDREKNISRDAFRDDSNASEKPSAGSAWQSFNDWAANVASAFTGKLPSEHPINFFSNIFEPMIKLIVMLFAATVVLSVLFKVLSSVFAAVMGG